MYKSVKDRIMFPMSKCHNHRSWLIGPLIGLAVLATVALAANPATFSDMPNGFWAQDAVQYLSKIGVLQGYPNGTFRGEQSITRYETADMDYRLVQYLNRQIAKGASSPKAYALLKEGLARLETDYASLQTQVLSLKNAAGTSTTGTLAANASVTNTVAADTSAVNTPTTGAATFSDIPNGFWAQSAVRYLAKIGVLQGYPNDTFRGTLPVTRYETAAADYRLIQYLNRQIAEGTLSPKAQARLKEGLAQLKANYASLQTRVSSLENDTASKAALSELKGQFLAVREALASTGNTLVQLQQALGLAKKLKGQLAESEAINKNTAAKLNQLAHLNQHLNQQLALQVKQITALTRFGIILNADIAGLRDTQHAHDTVLAAVQQTVARLTGQLEQNRATYATNKDLSALILKVEADRKAVESNTGAIASIYTQLNALEHPVSTRKEPVAPPHTLTLTLEQPLATGNPADYFRVPNTLYTNDHNSATTDALPAQTISAAYNATVGLIRHATLSLTEANGVYTPTAFGLQSDYHDFNITLGHATGYTPDLPFAYAPHTPPLPATFVRAGGFNIAIYDNSAALSEGRLASYYRRGSKVTFGIAVAGDNSHSLLATAISLKLFDGRVLIGGEDDYATTASNAGYNLAGVVTGQVTTAKGSIAVNYHNIAQSSDLGGLNAAPHAVPYSTDQVGYGIRYQGSVPIPVSTFYSSSTRHDGTVPETAWGISAKLPLGPVSIGAGYDLTTVSGRRTDTDLVTGRGMFEGLSGRYGSDASLSISSTEMNHYNSASVLLRYYTTATHPLELVFEARRLLTLGPVTLTPLARYHTWTGRGSYHNIKLGLLASSPKTYPLQARISYIARVLTPYSSSDRATESRYGARLTWRENATTTFGLNYGYYRSSGFGAQLTAPAAAYRIDPTSPLNDGIYVLNPVPGFANSPSLAPGSIQLSQYGLTVSVKSLVLSYQYRTGLSVPTTPSPGTSSAIYVSTRLRY